jgi:metal-sulfur cluster biosynthetic enzyme
MNKEAQCQLCPDQYCIESNSKIGKVRVKIDGSGVVVDATKTLIKDCPVKEIIEDRQRDDINDIRNY